MISTRGSSFFFFGAATENAKKMNANKLVTGNNSRISRTDNTTDKTSFNNSIIFKHKFKKERRTLSINTDFNLLSTSATSFLYSINNFGKVLRIDTVDQKKKSDNTNRKFLGKVAYTEPLSAKYSLELNYEFV